jgi:polysaccharide biosynthesis/export protein
MKCILKISQAVFILIMFLFTYSCIPLHQLKYVQSKNVDVKTYSNGFPAVNIIKPGNELYIRVSSFDDINYNFFSSQSNTNYMNYGTESSMALISYPVNDSGYVDFPILGHIYLKDLTLDQATLKMKNLLSEYFNQPTVLMRFVNKRITILGEVRNPGTYIFTKEHLNLMDAISLSGDITLHGNKYRVFLIRQEEGVTTKTKIDMTRDNLLLSSTFYVRSDDIIYVEPRNSVKWSAISVPISLVLSSIATALLVYSFIQF